MVLSNQGDVLALRGRGDAISSLATAAPQVAPCH